MLKIQILINSARKVTVVSCMREDPKNIASVYLIFPDGCVSEMLRGPFRGNGAAAWGWEARMNFFVDNDLKPGVYTAYVSVGGISESQKLNHKGLVVQKHPKRAGDQFLEATDVGA